MSKKTISVLSIGLALAVGTLVAASSVQAEVERRALRGDCNGDSVLNQADIMHIFTEIFDGDGNLAKDAPKGSFAGSVIGCDANKDKIIDAGDVSCAVLLLNGEKCAKSDR